MPTVTRDIIVSNKLGLHARPAMQLVDLANRFKSRVTLLARPEDSEPVTADGKSVMQVITLAATEGTQVTIEADGEDAQAAADELARLFERKFGEPD